MSDKTDIGLLIESLGLIIYAWDCGDDNCRDLAAEIDDARKILENVMRRQQPDRDRNARPSLIGKDGHGS